MKEVGGIRKGEVGVTIVRIRIWGEWVLRGWWGSIGAGDIVMIDREVVKTDSAKVKGDVIQVICKRGTCCFVLWVSTLGCLC